MFKPVVLIVVDGWGISERQQGNATLSAKLPTIEKLTKYYPHVGIQASGISVGLPWGEPGNSEVGHISLGTGQIIYQNMPRITMAIRNGTFYKNESFLRAIEHAKKFKSKIHLMGLLGKGGIHSNADHLYGLLELMQEQDFDQVYTHIFTDGRDSSPTSAVESIQELQKRIDSNKIGKIATLGGRYYGMDRNENWDRVQKSYDAMTKGEGQKITDPVAYIQESYEKEIFDEYIEPAVVMENGKPVATISENDALIFFNFREDRARQITKAFVLPGFGKFERQEIKNLYFVGMVQYEADLPIDVAFPVVEIKASLGSLLSQNKLTQLRIAETEKFAHVTYFFNGGGEEPYPGEDRVIVPSKDVARFDEAPEMSAAEITNRVIDFVQKEKYDFILINYANADIIGHTGNQVAADKAVEEVDRCLGILIQEVLAKNGCLLITADHGNVEEMISPRSGEKNTEHSANPVPLWFITKDNHIPDGESGYNFQVMGLLSDVAPTILDLFGIPKIKEMSGESLLSILGYQK